MQKLFGIKQAREYLGCGSTTINQLISTGKIAYIQHTVGGKRWIEQKILDDFIASGRIGGWKSDEQPRTKTVARPRSGFKRNNNVGTINKRERINSNGSIYRYYEGKISLGKDSTGHRVRKTVTGSNEDEVRASLNRIASRPRTNLDAERIVLEGYLTDWLDDVKANNSLDPSDEHLGD